MTVHICTYIVVISQLSAGLAKFFQRPLFVLYFGQNLLILADQLAKLLAQVVVVAQYLLSLKQPLLQLLTSRQHVRSDCKLEYMTLYIKVYVTL